MNMRAEAVHPPEEAPMEGLHRVPEPAFPIAVPDLSPLASSHERRVSKQEISVVGAGGEPILAQLVIERYVHLPESRVNNPANPYAAPVHIELRARNEAGDELFGMSGVLFETDKGKSWAITYRMVERAVRRKGYSQLGVQIFESAVRQISAAYPELAAPHLQIDTKLPGLARSVVDQTWLAQHHLAAYQHQQRRPDLGYLPATPDDADHLRELLTNPAHQTDEDIFHHAPTGPEVRLVKSLEAPVH